VTIKVKTHLEQDPNALALGVLLNDMLIFGRYFMRGDISEEPTVPQKLMLLDNSQRVLMATSRFVLKTVGLIIRMLQDIVTHMKPVHAGQQDEILFTTPTEGHLQPTVSRLYSIIYNNVAFHSLVSESRSGDKPELVIRSQLKFFFRIDGTCLTGDSVIVDSDTGLPYTVDDMVKGILPNRIHVLNQDTWKFESTDQFDVVDNGIRPVFRLTLKDGASIRATANHPFLTQYGWKRLDELTGSDFVVVPIRLTRANDGSVLSNHEARLLGYMIGDGGTTRRGLRFTNSDMGIVDDFRNVCSNWGCSLRDEGDYSYCPSGGYNKWNTNPLTDFVRDSGLAGKYSYQKRIPLSVFASDDNAVAQFLGAYFNCDGSAYISRNKSGYIEYCSTSKGLVEDVATLMLRYGIRGRILGRGPSTTRFKRKDGREYHSNSRESFRWITAKASDIRTFGDAVVCSGDKQVRLNKVIDQVKNRITRCSSDAIPRNIIDQEIERLWGQSRRKLFQEIGTLLYNKSYPLVSRQKVRKLNRVLKSPILSAILEGDVTFVGIKSIEACGEEQTYDLRVPPYHNFVANRIVVHNTGTDINMVNIHPRKIYADEQAWGIMNTHRSRLAALHPGGQVVYAGVPNDIRTSPFYALDATKDGDSWSRHKMSVLKANPLFLKKDAKTKRHLRQLVKDFGGRNSPQYKTQILGEWGDEASSSFPPGSIAWFTEGHPYFITILSGQQVKTALRQGNLPMELKVPHVRPKRACIGWDYGFSPDPTTFLVAIQIGDDPVWYTYCRISLYQTDMDSQFEVLKYLVTGILDNRVAMVSTDRQDGYQKMIHETNIHIFRDKCKLSNPGGQVEMDLETGEFIPDDMRDDPDIVTKRRLKKTVYQGRKYYMTAVMRRMMQATLLKADDYPRLMLGYDSEFENELVLVVERRTDKKIVYDLPKQGRTIGRVTPDQILDAARYLCDSIVTVDATGFRREPDMTELISEMGWVGKRLPFGARLPFD